MITKKRDVKNYPLESIEGSKGKYVSITRDAILKIISSLPEHTAVVSMRDALIDTFRAADSSIQTDWNGGAINRDYELMHSVLMGTASMIGYGMYYSYDREDYKDSYIAKYNIVQAVDVEYSIYFTDGAANTLGGFKPFNALVDLVNKNYKIQLSAPIYKNNVTLSASQDGGSTIYRFQISDLYGFFSSKMYLNDSYLHIGSHQYPDYKYMKNYIIKEVNLND